MSSWICAFLGIRIPGRRLEIVITLSALCNLVLFLIDRKNIFSEIRKNFRYILQSELVFLVFFLFFLLIRLGNPDLWHPYKGGEKPMDFSYFKRGSEKHPVPRHMIRGLPAGR